MKRQIGRNRFVSNLLLRVLSLIPKYFKLSFQIKQNFKIPNIYRLNERKQKVLND